MGLNRPWHLREVAPAEACQGVFYAEAEKILASQNLGRVLVRTEEGAELGVLELGGTKAADFVVQSAGIGLSGSKVYSPWGIVLGSPDCPSADSSRQQR